MVVPQCLGYKFRSVQQEKERSELRAVQGRILKGLSVILSPSQISVCIFVGCLRRSTVGGR